MNIISTSQLRKYRKHSRLSLSDIAFLMDLSDYTNISRFEKGLRSANLPLLMAYHLLFEVPTEVLFGQQQEIMRQLLVRRISALIENLRDLDDRPQNKGRISFLETALARLTSPGKNHE